MGETVDGRFRRGRFPCGPGPRQSVPAGPPADPKIRKTLAGPPLGAGRAEPARDSVPHHQAALQAVVRAPIFSSLSFYATKRSKYRFPIVRWFRRAKNLGAVPLPQVATTGEVPISPDRRLADSFLPGWDEVRMDAVPVRPVMVDPGAGVAGQPDPSGFSCHPRHESMCPMIDFPCPGLAREPAPMVMPDFLRLAGEGGGKDRTREGTRSPRPMGRDRPVSRPRTASRGAGWSLPEVEQGVCLAIFMATREIRCAS